MVRSGLTYTFGMGFWGPNGHDGVWHIALANSLARNGFSNLEMPVFAGSQLTNYHIGFDLILGFLRKITFIPTENLYFQILPVIVAVLTGILTYKFVLLWKKSKAQALWATFFVYFGGSFGWIVTLLRNGDIGGESMFWSQQAGSTLINPPFALSVVLILIGLILLVNLKNKFSIKCLLLLILIFGIAVQVKVYGGILSIGALFILGLMQILKERRYGFLALFTGSLIFAAALFLPLNKNSSSMLVFQPFWFLETMMALSDRFGWQKFYEAMITYRSGGVWVKALIAYTSAFVIFMVGNLGTRAIGVLEARRQIQANNPDYLGVFMLSVIMLGIFFPMIFLQKGTPWNTIQFFYYSLFFLGIFAGVQLGKMQERWKPPFKLFAMGTIILFTVPTVFSTVWYHYLPSRPPAKVSNLELEALRFLNKQPVGTVLTFPFDRRAAELAQANPPRPLYLYESTAYVSAFSDKPVYLEDEVNLDITGYDWKTRRKTVLDFLASMDHEKVRDFLRVNNIKYVYWVKPQRATLGESQLGMTRIFENKEVEIYKVD